MIQITGAQQRYFVLFLSQLRDIHLSGKRSYQRAFPYGTE